MSPSTAVVVLPLISAVIYTFSALMVKRAGSYGVGVWRIAFVTNQIVALVFSALWFFGGTIPSMGLLWQPIAVGFLLAMGQTFQFLALDRGDVSVAVPVFGLKVVLVGFFTTLLLTEPVTAKMWWAAVLSVLAVTCLNRKDKAARRVSGESPSGSHMQRDMQWSGDRQRMKNHTLAHILAMLRQIDLFMNQK